MASIRFHHDAFGGFHAVGGQQAIQGGKSALFRRPGDDQQLTAAGQVAFQQLHLFLGKITLGGVDQKGVGVLGNLIGTQQGEALQLQIGLFDLILELAGKGLLPVAFQGIDLGQLLGDHIVDGRGDGSLPVEGIDVGIGGVVHVRQVDVVIADVPALVAALHDQAVVGYVLVGILAGEGGKHVRVLLHHGNVGGQPFVLAQKIFDDLVLLAGLNHPVDGHVLLEGVRHHLGAAGDGVEIGGGHVVFGQGGGQHRCQHIHRHGNGQHQGGHCQRIGAAPDRNAAKAFLDGFHQLYLRFSRDCTVKNRPRPMTVA